jgi:hypothetical protein
MQIIVDNLHTIGLFHDDALNLYDTWDTPIVIVSDGAYGVDGFPADLQRVRCLV